MWLIFFNKSAHVLCVLLLWLCTSVLNSKYYCPVTKDKWIVLRQREFLFQTQWIWNYIIEVFLQTKTDGYSRSVLSNSRGTFSSAGWWLVTHHSKHTHLPGTNSIISSRVTRVVQCLIIIRWSIAPEGSLMYSHILYKYKSYKSRLLHKSN